MPKEKPQWTAEKINKEFRRGMYQVDVRYTSSTGATFVETVQTPQPGGNWPDREIRQRLQGLNAAILDNIALGVVAEEIKTPEPTHVSRELTEDEQRRRTFFENYDKLKEMKELVALGVQVDEEALTTLAQTVTSQYNPDFF